MNGIVSDGYCAHQNLQNWNCLRIGALTNTASGTAYNNPFPVSKHLRERTNFNQMLYNVYCECGKNQFSFKINW